ncbi:MAG: hypothetical protein HGA53_09120, partial [Anaerolineaceae bacterium]|nr:hypothetical protein [Anaerolineaceae bacterium]
MIGGKTCALLSCTTELGALLGGASIEKQVAMGKFGLLVGEAFQVWDDWLGIWGNADETGKSVESDLVTGKKTLPVCLGLQRSKTFAKRWEKGKIEPDEVAEISQMLAADGIKDETYQTSLARTNEAIQLLRDTVGDSEPGQALQDLTFALVGRKN